jgi:hypothetical protein
MAAQDAARGMAALIILGAVWPNQASADRLQWAQAAPVAFEFRGATRGRQGPLDHIWRLRADGSITGQSTERRGGGLGGYSIELTDTGRWQMRGAQLCIEWSGAFASLSGCYGIERRPGTHVRLAGPASFEGTLDPVLP